MQRNDNTERNHMEWRRNRRGGLNLKWFREKPWVRWSINKNWGKERETSTPGVQRCVHMRLSLLRMMQYCINLVEWCNNLRYFQDSMHFHHSQLDHHGPTDQPTNRPTDGRTEPLIELRVRIKNGTLWMVHLHSQKQRKHIYNWRGSLNKHKGIWVFI